MPRLIAIEGPEAGIALPVSGAVTYLSPSADRRLQLRRGGVAPAGGAVIAGDGPSGYRIGVVGGAGPAGSLQVNGADIEDAVGLNHGDLIRFAGATLIFDCDDHGATDTSPGELRAAAPAGPVPTPPLPAFAAPPPPAADPAADVPVGGGDSILYRRRVYDDAESAVQGVVGPAPSADSVRLATLLQVAAALGATLDLPELLTTLLDRVFEVVPASRGTILLHDRGTRKLRSMAAKVRGREAVEGAHVPVSRTIIREALRTRDAILTMDAQTDTRFRAGDSIAAAGIRSAACVPLVRSERVLGVIHLDTSERTRAFSRDDVELLAAIAGLAALAIENARLYQEAAERERLRYELQLATSIQQRLLPRAAPHAPGLALSGRMRPARELGGDIYDFVRGEDGAIYVFVGDVAGKGVGASLIMAMARSYFRPLTRSGAAPLQILVEMNRLLYDDTERDKFMSAICLRWDPAARELVYCGAGQEHLLVYRAASGACEAVPAGGVALAVVDDAGSYLEDTALALEPGDVVVLYSDGVTEAREPSGAFFGVERLRQVVEQAGGLAEPEAIVDAVVAAVQRFMAAAEQHDDITVVALKRTPA